MNKKNLSVVMAGAMLATSVAPVLADTTTDNQAPQNEFEVNDSNRGLLIKELRELLTSKYFSATANNEGYKHDGLSVYYVKIGAKYYDATAGKTASGYEHKNIESISDMEKALQNAGVDTKVYVYTRGYEEVTVNGKTYVNSFKAETYTEETLKAAANDAKASDKYVSDAKYYNGVLTVYLKRADQETAHNTLTLKVGDAKRNFNIAVDEAGVVTTNKNEVKDFAIADNAKKPIDDELLYTVTITNVDKAYNVALSDLYDGLFLTEKGQKVADTIEEYANTNGCELTDQNGKNLLATSGAGSKADSADIDHSKDGLYTTTLKFKKPVIGTNEHKEYTLKITTNDVKKLDLFVKGIVVKAETNNMGNGVVKVVNFPVEVLAGANRYETAVKVAKENANIRTVAKDGNIVLVNSNSLVDGLAAAPLAASVVNGTTLQGAKTTYAAPILLTDANGLPKATRDYMKEIIGQQQVGNLDKVTVYLVGGEAVISKTVENQLKDMGLRVVRAGGADREETSLKVAELMDKETNKTLKTPFVVGADGEADAMSIAGVAATEGRPIIVESRKGISEDTINYLKGYKEDSLTSKQVTILGGETVVSKDTENKMVASGIKVGRISGSDRQATNAEIIRTYHKNAAIQRVIVSKDGKGNRKSELIDALTATSLAVKSRGPIVLGTKSLSKDQINAMELKASPNGVYVYQVGYGVDRNVVKTIAERVGLAK